MISLRLSREARRDLQAIWNYTAQAWDEEQAEAYVRALHASMARLREFPELGPPHATRVAQLRKLASGHHLIFYLVEPEEIKVVRVLHERTDVTAQLGD
ncbi:MAG: type II toxin-antitoxin system RelE/ParE family toxin [Erythrobacter sp.]|nr:type II toxin-antitoxin system RelE/ParE family toxin [Erythrobacter sp.]